MSDSKKATICFLSPSLAEGSLAILKASLSLMTLAGCGVGMPWWGEVGRSGQVPQLVAGQARVVRLRRKVVVVVLFFSRAPSSL